MRYSSRLILVIAVLAVSVLPVATASAAPSAWQTVNVTLHQEEDGDTMLVSGDLPQTASLPAEAELSVPAGSEVQWIGEILGGPTSADPALKYVKSTVGKTDVYRFTLRKARTAQVEIPIPRAQTPDGINRTSSLKWSSAGNVREVRMSVRIPQAAQIVQSAPGASLQTGESGFNYYAKTVKNVKAGDQLGLDFAYSVPTLAASSAGSTQSGSDSLGLIVLMLVAIVVIALVVIAVRSKMVVRPSSGDSDSDSPDSRAEAREAKSGPKPVKPVQRVKAKAEADRADRSDGTESSPRRPALTGATKRNLIVAGVIGCVIVLAVFLALETSKPQVDAGSITKTFSQGQPCATATIPLTVRDGADPLATAEVLFSALKPLRGMNTATYDPKTSTIKVGFCESEASEGSVRQALTPTGMVAPAGAVDTTSSAAPAPAAPAPSGGPGVQALAVDTSSGSFVPSQLTARAGLPVEITFGQGSGCLAEVVFPDLKIRQSLEGGPVTIKLPALKPGTYAFACGMDMQRGSLVVQ